MRLNKGLGRNIRENVWAFIYWAFKDGPVFVYKNKPFRLMMMTHDHKRPLYTCPCDIHFEYALVMFGF